MWKVKLLLGACACVICYLLWTGVRYLFRGGEKMPVKEGAWYGDPVTFYVWAGLLAVLCAAAAVCILWKDEPTTDVKIGRHKVKGALTILMDMLVVLLLHTYLSGIANNQEQLVRLPELLPIHAFLTSADGSRQAGLFIREEVVDGLQASGYVKELELTVRMWSGIRGKTGHFLQERKQNALCLRSFLRNTAGNWERRLRLASIITNGRTKKASGHIQRLWRRQTTRSSDIRI